MLRFLLGTDIPRVMDVAAFSDCRTSERKLRLFSCACYFRIRHRLSGPLAPVAVEIAEQFADGLVPAWELNEVHHRLLAQLDAIENRWRASQGAEREALRPVHDGLALALQVTRREAPKAAYYASSNAYLSVAALPPDGPDARSVQGEEKHRQADLLRCLLGPALFRPLPASGSWREGNDGLVTGLAVAADLERDLPARTLNPLRLAVLADALEEAGCTEQEVLDHLREPGPHLRGCWAVDLALGRS
jgi:hypothetical protein